MRAQLEQRLKALKAEFEAGQKALAELEAQQANLRSTLLRISGAIQVLEEELTRDGASGNDAQQAGGSGDGAIALGQKVVAKDAVTKT